MASNLNQADLCIKNVRVFNSYFRNFVEADVYIKDGKFLYIDKTFPHAYRIFDGDAIRLLSLHSRKWSDDHRFGAA